MLLENDTRPGLFPFHFYLPHKGIAATLRRDSPTLRERSGAKKWSHLSLKRFSIAPGKIASAIDCNETRRDEDIFPCSRITVRANERRVSRFIIPPVVSCDCFAHAGNFKWEKNGAASGRAKRFPSSSGRSRSVARLFHYTDRHEYVLYRRFGGFTRGSDGQTKPPGCINHPAVLALLKVRQCYGRKVTRKLYI